MIAPTHQTIRERNDGTRRMERAPDAVPSAAPGVRAEESIGHRSCAEGASRSSRRLSPPVSGRHEFSIRVFDIVTSVAILLGTWPMLLVAALLVKPTSPGPVIYRQQRVGRHCRVFTLYKLRTMIEGAERDTGPVWASAQDHRITPVGPRQREHFSSISRDSDRRHFRRDGLHSTGV